MLANDNVGVDINVSWVKKFENLRMNAVEPLHNLWAKGQAQY